MKSVKNLWQLGERFYRELLIVFITLLATILIIFIVNSYLLPTTKSVAVVAGVHHPVTLKLLADKKAPETSTKPVTLSRGGERERDTSTMLYNFQVTYYNNDASYTNGITQSGVATIAGRTIAVDTSIIPMGTWLELTFPDGRTFIRKAEDTGGAIHGKVIDMYSSCSNSELLSRGRIYNVTVRVLRRN